jgi:formylmethanofuran dehydrogenase subunit B
MASSTPTTADVQTKSTFCRVCHASCPMEVDVVDNRVIAVRGVMDDPLFEGYTCIKGRQLPDQMADPNRLRAPLRRRPDGTFEETSSPEALDEIAAELRRIIDTYGPRAVASYTGTGGYQNSVAVGAARSFHQGIDSVSFYTSVTIDQPAKGLAMYRLGGWEAGYHSFTDSDVHMAIGYNSMVSSYAPLGGLQGTNPFVVMRRRKADGMKLIVIDPRRTELASFADIHLQIRPGEDPTLLAGMIRIVLDEGLQDHEFCERWVSQLDELAAGVDGFTLDVVAERCQLDPDDVLAATRMFAAGPKGVAGTGTGPNMAAHSSLTEHLTVVLNTILGRVNREGDLLENGLLLYPEMPVRAQVTPPRPPTNGPPSRIRGLRGYRGEMPTAALAEEILTPGEGRIRALIVSGGNPAVAFPDQELTLQALADLELLVVIDHRMTPTAEFAHYVIAPTLSLERADVPHLMDRWFRQPYTNYTEPVVERDGDVLNEWEVFWELASRPRQRPAVAGRISGHVRAPEHRRDHRSDLRRVADAPRRGPPNRARCTPTCAMVAQPADDRCHREVHAGSRRLHGPNSPSSSRNRRRCSATSTCPTTRSVWSAGVSSTCSTRRHRAARSRRKGTTNPAYMHPDDVSELRSPPATSSRSRRRAPRSWAVVEPSDDIKRGVISMAHSWGGRRSPTRKYATSGRRRAGSCRPTGHDPVTGMVVSSAIPVAVSKVGCPHDDQRDRRRRTPRVDTAVRAVPEPTELDHHGTHGSPTGTESPAGSSPTSTRTPPTRSTTPSPCPSTTTSTRSLGARGRSALPQRPVVVGDERARSRARFVPLDRRHRRAGA